MFTLTIHEEELRGRMSRTRRMSFRDAGSAEETFRTLRGELAREHRADVDEDIADGVAVVEFFPRMRVTLTLAEAD